MIDGPNGLGALGSQQIIWFPGFFGLVYLANITLVRDHAHITSPISWPLSVLRPLGMISIFRSRVEYQRLIDGVVNDNGLISEVPLPALEGHNFVFLLIFLLVTLALEIISILAIQFCLFIDGCVLVWHIRLLDGSLSALLRGRVLNGQIRGVNILLQHLQLTWRLIRQSVVQKRRRWVNFTRNPSCFV